MYETNKGRQILLRRPEQLPNERDMADIRAYSLDRIKSLTTKFNFFDKSDFVELRDVALSLD